MEVTIAMRIFCMVRYNFWNLADHLAELLEKNPPNLINHFSLIYSYPYPQFRIFSKFYFYVCYF